MRKSSIAKILWLIAIVALLGGTLTLNRDYQDSWILEGLEIPFTFFAITYGLAFFTEKRTKYLLLIAVVSCAILAIIPGLKYEWFLGVNVDQHRQYNLANYVVDEGYILPEKDWNGGDVFYTTTPLLHLLFAAFSILVDIPVLFVVKFLPILFIIMYPLLTYFAVLNLDLSKEKQETVLKYALFISSIPIEQALGYLASGSMFGVLLCFLIITQVLVLIRKKSSRAWVLLAIFSFALVMSHSFSALQISLLFISILFLQRFSSLKIKSYLKLPTVTLIFLLNIIWLIFPAERTLKYILKEFSQMGILLGVYPSTGVIPSRTFELASVSIFEAFKTIIVYDGAHIVLLSIVIVSLIFFLKNKNTSFSLWSNSTKFLGVFVMLILFLLVFAVVTQIGGGYWLRLPRFASIFYGVFFGFFVFYLSAISFSKQKFLRKILHPLIASLLIVFMLCATLQFYACQPFISSANVLSENLPTDEPLVYVNQVNSVYQRQMILFTEKYVNGTIACDVNTKNQITGLTHYDFAKSHLAFTYPFSGSYINGAQLPFDYFLIHLPGKSGSFYERAELRTSSLVISALNSLNYSLIYNNGESFILNNK